MTIGYLVDSFDLLNVRHIDLIAQANDRCSRVVAGVFSDEVVRRLLGGRPVVPLDERMALVAHLRGVSQVTVHDEATVPEQGAVTLVAEDTLAGLVLPTNRAIVRLCPRRYTASATLRQALHPVMSPRAVG